MDSIDRRRYPHGSNGAGQIVVRCRCCATAFDVGFARATHPSFDPLCFDCFSSPHRPQAEVAHPHGVELFCTCGWFTFARSLTKRSHAFLAHRARVEKRAL